MRSLVCWLALASTAVALKNIPQASDSVSSPILPDGTIRPFGKDSRYCLYKRGMDFKNAHAVWLWPCNPKHTLQKYVWFYDQATGLIKSVGSMKKYPDSPYCLWITHPKRSWRHRLKIKKCDESDETQQFDYYNGRIYMRHTPDLCLAFAATGGDKPKKAHVVATKCTASNWAGEMRCAAPTKPSISQCLQIMNPDHKDEVCAGAFKYNVIYINWSFDWTEGIISDIKRCVDAGFNVIALAFILGAKGTYEPRDAYLKWTELDSFEREEILDYIHSRGAKIVLSIGGSTDRVDGNFVGDLSGLLYKKSGGKKYAKIAALDAMNFGLDGVDFAIKVDNGNAHPFQSGYAHKFLTDTLYTARLLLPREEGFLISYAPMASHASSWAGHGHGYRDWIKQHQEELDFVSLQYFGQDAYETPDTTFKAADAKFSGSAIKELLDAGLPKDKLVVGKPINSKVSLSGYLSVDQMYKEACAFKKESGWYGGFMTWMYDVKSPDESLQWAQTLNARCPGEILPCERHTKVPNKYAKSAKSNKKG